MRRWAAGFGLLGVLVVVLRGLGGDAPLDVLLLTALLWGATFAVLGLALGWVARALLQEVGDGRGPITAERLERERKSNETAASLLETLLPRERGAAPSRLEERTDAADKTESPNPAEKALP